MPYCEKCGQKMSDDAVFCSKCGRKAVITTNNKAEEYKVEEHIAEEYKFDEPEATQTDDAAEVEVKRGLSKKSKRIIFVAVMAITLVVVGLTLFFVLRDNNLVTKNEDGETVFAFTFSEFIDRYNENAPEKILMSDFEKDEDEFELWEDDYSISVHIDKGNNPCYVTNVVLYHYGDNDEVPDEAVAFLRALYPRMSEKQAYEDLEYLMIHGSNDFKNVMLFYENNDDYQYWNYHPFD